MLINADNWINLTKKSARRVHSKNWPIGKRTFWVGLFTTLAQTKFDIMTTKISFLMALITLTTTCNALDRFDAQVCEAQSADLEKIRCYSELPIVQFCSNEATTGGKLSCLQEAVKNQLQPTNNTLTKDTFAGANKNTKSIALQQYLKRNFAVPGYATSWFPNILSAQIIGTTAVVITDLPQGHKKLADICAAVSGFVYMNNESQGTSAIKILSVSNKTILLR